MFKVYLDRLMCIRTDDLWLDECRLLVQADQSAPAHIKLPPATRRSVISLARNYQVENHLSIRLLELDRVGDFGQDGHLFGTGTGDALLGQVIIRDAGACSQAAVFRTSRAHYELTYRLAPMFELRASVGANGTNQADDILALKQRLIRLGFDWLTADTTMNDSTIQTIRLFQSIGS